MSKFYKIKYLFIKYKIKMMLTMIMIAITTFIISFVSSYILDRSNRNKMGVHLKNSIVAVVAVYIVNNIFEPKVKSYLSQPIATGNPSF